MLRVNPTATPPVSSTTTLANAIAEGNYATFSITIPETHVLSLTDFTYDAARGGTGTRTFYLFSSINGFTAGNVIESNDVTTQRPTLSNYVVELTDPAYQNLTNTTVEFRLYYTTASSGSSLETDNWVLNGTVSAIPEPSMLGACGLAAAGCFAWIRRQRQ